MEMVAYRVVMKVAFIASIVLASVLLTLTTIHDEGEWMNKQDELAVMAFTTVMEAEGEPDDGKLGVAWVIMNRSRKRNMAISDVCLEPYAFSAWNTDSSTRKRLSRVTDAVMNAAKDAVTKAYYGAGTDPTHGATHYLNIELTKKLRGGTLPNWLQEMTQTVKIGKHTFYREV